MNKNFTRLLLFFLSVFIIFGIYYWFTSKDFTKLNIDIKRSYDKKNIIPVVVIGSGPAGLSAALYTARSAISTVVFEGKKPGGQLIDTTYVENWPGTKKMLGSELISQNRKQAEKFGAVMVPDSIECVDFSTWPFRLKTDEGHEIYALSIIIATGANPKLLNIKGEKEYWGYGVTTCAICDAPFYKGKKVVVVGGGDSAVEEATLLTAYADNVTMLVRGDSMRAVAAMQQRIKDSDKIKVLYNTQITQILGDGKKITSIELKNNKDNTISNMPIDGVFLAIGHEPNTQIFKDFLKIDSQGYLILSGDGQQTSLPGIYAAGDVVDHRYRQAGVAAGDGIKAALDAVAFLQNVGFNEHIYRKIEKNYYEPVQGETTTKLQRIKTNKEFDVLAKQPEPLIVDVGASYCTSCKVLLPVVEHVAANFKGKANFAQIDLDDDPIELKKRFNIASIPVVLVFKKGKLLSRYDKKIFTKQELRALVSQLVFED